MPESQTDGPGPNVEADKPQPSFSSKAASYSQIVSTACWFFLLLFLFARWDFFEFAWFFEGLFLVAVSSFFAGFIGMDAPKKREVAMGALGILLSVSFGFCDLFVVAFSGIGHNC